VNNKWKHLRDNFRTELNKMKANKSGDPGLYLSERESRWRCFKMLLLMKNISNSRKIESNMQFQSKQLDWESTDPEKYSCTSISNDFVAECSSAGNSIHTPAPSETSRSSAQRSTKFRSGRRPLEEGMIEIKGNKLDLIQWKMDMRTGTRRTTS
jgi:hypothetical protein